MLTLRKEEQQNQMIDFIIENKDIITFDIILDYIPILLDDMQ